MSIPATPSAATAPPHPTPWLHALVSNVQDAIVLLDSSGRVTYESPSACEILGIPTDDVLGAFGLKRIHPDERDAVVEAFERTLAVPGAVARATYRFQRADGDWRHLEALAKNLVDDPHLHGVLITFRDVTERLRALEAAEKASRARDEFLARMGRELQPPLRAILGWTCSLKAGPAAEHPELAEQIERAARHLLMLVEEALDLASVQESGLNLQIGRTEVQPLVQESVEEVLPLAVRRDVAIHFLPPSQAVAVLADPFRLRQILVSLLTNAIRYNRHAGEVTVSWRLAGGRTVQIAVSDTGPGITPSMVERIFERFDRLGMENAALEGSGLGLAISSRLVEMMGGTMSVENRPGSGATFRVELPAA